MRKQGWPFPNNPPILNEPNSDLTDFNQPPDDPSIINLAERFNDGIVFRTDEFRGNAILGEFVGPGDHLRILIQGPGRLNIDTDQFENVDSKFTWAVALRVDDASVKVIRQDGTVEVFLRKDTRVQAAFFPYAVGNPVWYDFGAEVATEDYKTGILTDIEAKPGTEDPQTFTIKDDETDEIVQRDFRSVLIRMGLPGQKPNFDSNYNTTLLTGQKPGLVLPDAKP
jgi:hypothetical protein